MENEPPRVDDDARERGESVGAAVTARAPDDRPLSRQGWVWAVSGGLTVLVLGGAAAVIAVDAQTNNSGAVRAVAEQYIEAIADGDAAAAEQYFEAVGGHGRSGSPEPEALASAEHIVDPELERFRVDFDRGRASGDVTFVLDGARYTDRIEMTVDGDEEWHVVSGLRYELTSASEFGEVLGLRGMSGPLPGNGATTPVYAGDYQVVSFNEFLRTAHDARLQAVSQSPYLYGDEWIEAAPEYSEELQRQIDEWYGSCAEETDPEALRGCGIDPGDPGFRFATASEIEAEVEMIEPPSVPLRSEGYAWQSLEGLGRFSVVFTGRDADGEAITAEREGRAFEADIEVRADEEGLEAIVHPY